GIGPVVVSLDADHKVGACELIVATALHAAEPTVGSMAAEGGTDRDAANADRWIAGRHCPALVGPEAAGVAADEAAGPGEHLHRDGCGLDRHTSRHVRRGCGPGKQDGDGGCGG